MKLPALTAIVLAVALEACAPQASQPEFMPGETWTDEHGNECTAETAHLAACTTPDGYAFTIETKPSPESLTGDPAKAVMYVVTKIR